MNKKKLLGYVMTGVLSVGVIGAGTIHTFAAINSSSTKTEVSAKDTSLDAATKAKVQAIKDQLKSDLSKLGVTLPEKKDRLTNLDAETKKKAEAIIEKMKTGAITEGEAKTQLAKLGVDLPIKGEKQGRFANLDAETKAKVEAIFAKVKAGTLTKEEAESQLTKLGVELPDRGQKDMNFLVGLDADTKEKAQALIDDAEKKLADLGLDHISLFGHKGAKNR